MLIVDIVVLVLLDRTIGGLRAAAGDEKVLDEEDGFVEECCLLAEGKSGVHVSGYSPSYTSPEPRGSCGELAWGPGPCNAREAMSPNQRCACRSLDPELRCCRSDTEVEGDLAAASSLVTSMMSMSMSMVASPCVLWDSRLKTS